MIDFSRLRTLEQVQAERARAERDVVRQQERLQEDMCGIQASWQRREHIVRGIVRAVGYFVYRPQNRKTLLGILFSALLTRIFRRRS